MDIKNIIGCLNANGISFPPEFATIEKDGCINVFEGLMQTNLERIETMVRFGSNNGFNSDLKNDITKLVKLTCKISQEKKVKKHEKYVIESKNIYSEVERNMKEKGAQFDMVKEVNTHIDNYILGMEVLLNMDVAQDRKPVLEAGIEKCKLLKKTLGETMNTSTNSALNYAKDIIAELQDWADIVANKMHDESDLAILDKALEIANTWKNNHEGVKTGLFTRSNKAKDISELYFKEDNLSMIGKSKVVQREIDIFKQNLSEYKSAVCGDAGEELKKTLDNKKQEKAKLEAEKKELVVQYKNGEISKMDLYEECVDIDQQIDDLKEDIEDIKMDLEEKKMDTRSTGKVLQTLESLNNQVLSYKADPIYFALLGEELDFSKLTKVMRGAGTEAEIDYVLDVQSILDRVKNRRQKMDSSMVRITREKVREKTLQRRAERQARLDEQMKERAQEREQNKDIADDYIANLLGETKQAETAQNNNTQTQETVAEENTRIALGDDEL